MVKYQYGGEDNICYRERSSTLKNTFASK